MSVKTSIFGKVFRYIHLASAVLSVIVVPMAAYDKQWLEAVFYLSVGTYNGLSYYSRYHKKESLNH